MSRNLPSRIQIIDVITSANRAIHAREVSAVLEVSEESYPGFLRMLDDLVYQGVLTARPGQKFSLAGPNVTARTREEREGVITVAPRGFGFVSSATAIGDDVYVARESLGGAMHGDTVKVNVRSRGARGPEGEVTAVIARHIKRAAGTLRRRGKSAWLEPDDTRIRGPIVLEAGVDTRGNEGNSGNDGDAAVVSIARYPEVFDENPIGKLEAVLGRPGEISVEVAKVLVREQVEEVHSPEAFAEAEAYGEEVPEAMLEGREDLTHIPLPTIDPEDARDHDDAVWVERAGDGYRAWIAIADVSSYVRPDTHIDREAFARGCSIYLPDRAIPMLPRPLSSNLCSLLPGVIRLCLAVEIDLDGGGNVCRSRLIRGFIRSAAKLTYGGVARALGLSDAPPRDPAADGMVDGLRVAYELSRKLRTRRLKRGAVDFDLPEAKIALGEDGKPIDIQRRTQDAGVKRAYQLIEELMLLANEVVAGWFAGKKLPAVYRVHAAPDPQKLLRFSNLCEELGIEFDPEIAEDPRQLTRLLKSFADHPKASVLNMLLLRSMKQATYDVANIGHSGSRPRRTHSRPPSAATPTWWCTVRHAVLTSAGKGKAGSRPSASCGGGDGVVDRRAPRHGHRTRGLRPLSRGLHARQDRRALRRCRHRAGRIGRLRGPRRAVRGRARALRRSRLGRPMDAGRRRPPRVRGALGPGRSARAADGGRHRRRLARAARRLRTPGRVARRRRRRDGRPTASPLGAWLARHGQARRAQANDGALGARRRRAEARGPQGEARRHRQGRSPRGREEQGQEGQAREPVPGQAGAEIQGQGQRTRRGAQREEVEEALTRAAQCAVQREGGRARKAAAGARAFSLPFLTTASPIMEPIAAMPMPPQMATLAPRVHGFDPSLQSSASPTAVNVVPTNRELAVTNHPQEPSFVHEARATPGVFGAVVSAGRTGASGPATATATRGGGGVLGALGSPSARAARGIASSASVVKMAKKRLMFDLGAVAGLERMQRLEQPTRFDPFIGGGSSCAPRSRAASRLACRSPAAPLGSGCRAGW